MATETTSASRDLPPGITRSLKKVRQSNALQGIVLGLVLIVTGMVMADGAVAGMLGIYGATAVIVSTVAHFTVLALRRNRVSL